MTDDPAPAERDDGQPTVEQAALAAESVDGAAPLPPAPPIAASGAVAADERPELAVGAAFAGGLVLALFLKRLAR